MVLDEIVLHDFGSYGGRQAITLTPVGPDRPIILFGGLNGGGKTTLLDALQLCFFGNVAQCSGRSDLPYDEYLRRSVHRGALLPEAAVEVSFRHTVDGEEQKWRLTRSWRAGDAVRERFQVFRDDVFDKAASEHWSAQVEDFIPPRIAPLFLFDGEKVEGYADLDEAPNLIRTAIQNLLGLDIVERLGVDLMSIERKRKSDLATPAEAEELTELRREIQSLSAHRARLAQERASALNELDQLKRKATELDHRYDRDGGALYEDRGRLEAELAVTKRGHDALRRSLVDIAAGALPLVLVKDLLIAVGNQAGLEAESALAEQTAKILSSENATLLTLPAIAKLSKAAQQEIAAHLQVRVDTFQAAATGPRLLELDATTRASVEILVSGGLEETASHARDLLTQERQISTGVEQLQGVLSAVPGPAAIVELIAQREGARDAVRLAEFEQARRDEEMARLDREIEAARVRETRLLESTARMQFEQEDVGRLLRHSSKVRATLEKFRSAVVARHVARIEAFVLESFRQLVRKQTLVVGLTIDPETFQLNLHGRDSAVLTAERLSAGERQLFAIAILWGLARASGRPLPMVIDTPLGRLDAEHRSRLVSRYFPHASHQVMLLSTDEEITREHYQMLSPAVGRSYRLRFDEGEQRTVVETGYFEKAA